MKKVISILLVMLMVFACFSLTACFDDKKSNKGSSFFSNDKDDDAADDDAADDVAADDDAADVDTDDGDDNNFGSLSDGEKIENNKPSNDDGCFNCTSSEVYYTTEDGYDLCEDCFFDSDVCAICDSCNEVYYLFYEDGYDTYCYDCMEDSTSTSTSGKCEHCSKEGFLYTTDDLYELCYDCFMDTTAFCDFCDDLIYYGAYENGLVYCPECFYTYYE